MFEYKIVHCALSDLEQELDDSGEAGWRYKDIIDRYVGTIHGRTVVVVMERSQLAKEIILEQKYREMISADNEQ